MCRMYSRSKVMFEQSKEALAKVATDDAYLDAACFEAQQALEFLLKEILGENGVAYERTHSIGYLAEQLRAIDFSFDRSDDLELLADTITGWEEGSRYGKGVRTTAQTVRRVHNIYKSLNDAFLEQQEKNNEEPQE